MSSAIASGIGHAPDTGRQVLFQQSLQPPLKASRICQPPRSGCKVSVQVRSLWGGGCAWPGRLQQCLPLQWIVSHTTRPEQSLHSTIEIPASALVASTRTCYLVATQPHAGRQTRLRKEWFWTVLTVYCHQGTLSCALSCTTKEQFFKPLEIFLHPCKVANAIAVHVDVTVLSLPTPTCESKQCTIIEKSTFLVPHLQPPGVRNYERPPPRRFPSPPRQ
jgi:hypothetical protein